MELQETIGKRLKNARIMRGLSMDQLCTAMNGAVSKMAISKYENGKMSPGSSILIAFSEALGFPVDYFVKPFSIRIESVKFRRRKSSLGARATESIRQNIASLAENYLEIEEICGETAVFSYAPRETSVSTGAQVRNAALALRESWHIGSDGIVNVINLLEEHGVKVLEIDAPLSFDGLSSMVNERFPVVVINRNFTAERKRFTALHELGHLVLQMSAEVTEKQEEQLCNLFASEMLIPGGVFSRFLGGRRTDISYEELKALQIQYGISCDALMYKAYDAEIISEQRYRSYCIRKNQAPAFRETVERSLCPAEESTRYRRLVFKALAKEDITFSKAASLLNESVDSIRRSLAVV